MNDCSDDNSALLLSDVIKRRPARDTAPVLRYNAVDPVPLPPFFFFLPAASPDSARLTSSAGILTAMVNGVGLDMAQSYPLPVVAAVSTATRAATALRSAIWWMGGWMGGWMDGWMDE